MNRKLTTLAFAVALMGSSSIFATGLATCDSGDEANWKPTTELQTMLEAKGWTVKRIKVDGGCYEVYALDENGKKVEAYFHPLTLDPVPLDGEKAK